MSDSSGSLITRLPTVLWIAGATLAAGALTPVVGQTVTDPPPPAAAPSGTGEEPSDGQDTGGPGYSGGAGDSATGEPADPDTGDTGSGGDGGDGGGESGPGPADRLIDIAESVLGRIAVDAEGRTLYLSVLDSTDPPASACLSRECLENWPPVYLPDGTTLPDLGEGIDAGLLGALERPDGTWQATLGGWPLYRYAGDDEPGEVAGDGMGGTWFAVSPEGAPTVR
ncbi:hypothetical protein [Streptomyces sp. YIM 98790]|uniref:COG4315 family predicted lipoprotein n=1 Tax=Streptomyces sp. YIM 98790 TaxID=2689077 RepID=UPI00140DB6E0|nr:hypothetical protein [Streptomyces sp. YIM 98790]